MKKAIVCGAGGFIGGHMVKRLLDEGYKVLALDIKPRQDWYQVHEEAMNQGLFDLRDAEERNCFERAGAHDTKCTEVVALASKWAIEIIGKEIIKDQQMSLK